MPAFDSPILMLIFGGLLVASVVMAVRQRDALLDATYTADDRIAAMRLALFVLLPLSVLLHEAGHAVAVWAFGGEVVGFGFFFIAGYVEYLGAFTPLQEAITAAAGTVVNIVLALIAISWFWFRPSKYAALNDLLFTFVGLQILNALVVYPLLDLGGLFVGDWSVIYSRATPVFSIAFAVVHATLLLLCWLLWKHPGFRVGHAQRTAGVVRLRARHTAPTTNGTPHAGSAAQAGGAPQSGHGRSTQRNLFPPDAPAGATQASTGRSPLLTGTAAERGNEGVARSDTMDAQRHALLVAAALAVEGWQHHVDISSGNQAGGAQAILRWQSDGFHRALLVHATSNQRPNPHLEVHGAVRTLGQGEAMPPYQRELLRMDGYPEAQELAPYLSRFLAYVDTWDGTVVISPN